MRPEGWKMLSTRLPFALEALELALKAGILGPKVLGDAGVQGGDLALEPLLKEGADHGHACLLCGLLHAFGLLFEEIACSACGA